MKQDQAAQGNTVGRPEHNHVMRWSPLLAVEQAVDARIVRRVRVEGDDDLALTFQGLRQRFRSTVRRGQSPPLEFTSDPLVDSAGWARGVLPPRYHDYDSCCAGSS